MKKFIQYFLIVISSIFANNIYRIPIEGTIDLGLPPFIERTIKEAEKNDVEAIIFDINTFGGRVDAATQIKDAILATDILTVAFINRRAISAGALISLSCEKIYMTGGGLIGAATAVKKGSRVACEGVVLAEARDGHAVLLEVNSETDFTAKNEHFQGFVQQVLSAIFSHQPTDLAALMALSVGGQTLEEIRKALVGRIGENIQVRRFAIFSGAAAAYQHGIKIGVIVQQIYARFAKGLTQDPRFAIMGKAMEMLMGQSRRAIEKGRIYDLNG